MKAACGQQMKLGRNESMSVNVKIHINGLILAMKGQKTLKWKVVWPLNF